VDLQIGHRQNSKNSKFSSLETIRKQWTANWQMQNKSAVSKLSSTNMSIETIWLQLTTQQQENKKLMDLTQKLKDNAKNRNKKHKQQMGNSDKQWKEHMDKETAAWTDRLKQVKQILETTTNQTIKMHETTND
jgi:hypothetical protein